jgi:hypothetical protein
VGKKSHPAHPVVEADEYQAFSGEGAAVEDSPRRAADEEAAVNPDHDLYSFQISRR